MVKENTFLRDLAELAEISISFKDESILPGTCWIDEMPMDITIRGNRLILNSVGEFSGDYSSFTKSKNRGKGRFRKLIPYLRQLLQSYDMELRVYLTPISPVWKDNYILLEAENPSETKCHWYVDISPDDWDQSVAKDPEYVS